jgi:thiol-disulfide isomerase/thioredoxin
MRRIVLSTAALGALLALAGCGVTVAGRAPSAAQVRSDLAGSPAPLAALHSEANELLEHVTARRFSALLDSLHGYPVIVNKWASWCGPCQGEFPVFQQVGAKLGRRVAFVGIDAGDTNAGARAFLARHPVSYPSFTDPDEALAAVVNATEYYPMTVFLSPTGQTAFIHQGPYTSASQLTTDIGLYLNVR